VVFFSICAYSRYGALAKRVGDEADRPFRVQRHRVKVRLGLGGS
jgi:hypothetical protein